jgi:hypothetical protein
VTRRQFEAPFESILNKSASTAQPPDQHSHHDGAGNCTERVPARHVLEFRDNGLRLSCGSRRRVRTSVCEIACHVANLRLLRSLRSDCRSDPADAVGLLASAFFL